MGQARAEVRPSSGVFESCSAAVSCTGRGGEGGQSYISVDMTEGVGSHVPRVALTRSHPTGPDLSRSHRQVVKCDFIGANFNKAIVVLADGTRVSKPCPIRHAQVLLR